MTTPKLYKYKNTPSGRSISLGARLDRRNKDAEAFSGAVNGVKASDLEERYARALRKYEIDFDFRFRISSPLLGTQRITQQFLNMEGEVEVDFLVRRQGKTTPVFIDGNIGHFYTQYQADNDAIKTNATNDFGRVVGWYPAVRVPFWEMGTQEQTDRTVREMFSGSFVATRQSTITVNSGAITNDGSGYEWRTPGRVE